MITSFGDFAVVAGSMRAFREPGIEFPGLLGLPVWDGNQEIFEVNPDGLGLFSDEDVPVGASVSATGPLAFRFGDYQIWPTALSVSGTITPDPVRERGHGEVIIGSLNMERLFSSDSDFADRLITFSRLIRQVLCAPDILAVQEVGDLATLTSLATKIGIDDPTITYTAFLEEGNDVGGIDVGFLVRGTVKNIVITQLGKTETFIDPTDFSVDIIHDRPPLLLDHMLTSEALAPIVIGVPGDYHRAGRQGKDREGGLFQRGDLCGGDRCEEGRHVRAAWQ